MKIRTLLIVLVFLTVKAFGQNKTDEFFSIEFDGHKFLNTGVLNFDPDRLTYILWDNLPRDWSNNSTSQFLITKTKSNDTLLFTVKIEFPEIIKDTFQKGSFPLGKNSRETNSSTNCPFPKGENGPNIEVQLSPVNQETSKIYMSGFYRFHQDSGNLVIEDIQTDEHGTGFISGYFNGTISNEITNIDTDIDEDAVCKPENYKYDTQPIQGKFRLRLTY